MDFILPILQNQGVLVRKGFWQKACGKIIKQVVVTASEEEWPHWSVKQRQQQEPPFHMLHVAPRAVQAVEQQNHQTWCPAHDKGPWREREEATGTQTSG